MSKSNKSKKSATTKSKAVVKAVTPIFNAKNAKAFADYLFSDKGGVLTCVKLCDGSLQTKDGKQTLHCAVGEAYATFVNPSLKSVLQTQREDGPTETAIDALVNVALLKRTVDRSQLSLALQSCVESNDDDQGNSTVSYIERAEVVADTWLEEVVPLLK